MKIAFCDRDGTINRDYPDDVWESVDEPEFLSGAIEGLRQFRSVGYEIILVTNQYLIGEGFITLEQYERFSERLLKRLRMNGVDILDVFYCPHKRSDGCDCMKPKLGMLYQALNKYPNIEISRSFFVGDAYTDMAFANAAGLTFWGIGLPCENSAASLSFVKI